MAATAREALAGFAFNNFGFTSCGLAPSPTGIAERFDDIANTQTGRLAATARYYPTGYSFNNIWFFILEIIFTSPIVNSLSPKVPTSST